ncbi:MAG: hypothetical protein ACXABY_21285 [Candidatus Thorarchaeota archaeon]|jgi:hypothetical protein
MTEPPDEKFWRANWDEHQVKQLLELAQGYIMSGAMNMRAAWRAAEEQFADRISPYFRKAFTSDRLEGSEPVVEGTKSVTPKT